MKFCYVMKEEDAAPMLAAASFNSGLGSFGCGREEIGANFDDIAEKGFYAERKAMEVRPDFKQIIPCFLIRDRNMDKVLIYQRKATHTESRLAGMWTPVFGGHVDPGDTPSLEDTNLLELVDGVVLAPIVEKALRREMKEETGIDMDASQLYFEGFLYDPSNEVGTVHLGVVFTYYAEITDKLVQQITALPEIHRVMVVNEECLVDVLNGSEMILESWAQIALSHLVAIKEISNGN